MKRRFFFSALFGGGSLAAQTRINIGQINLPGAGSANLVAGDFSAVKVGAGLSLAAGVLTATAPQVQSSGGYAPISMTLLDPSKMVFTYLQANPALALRNLQVYRNGVFMEPGYDYDLDQLAGTVTFRPMPVGQPPINILTDRVRFMGVQSA